MMENGMTTEGGLWNEFLPLVYGREAIQDRAAKGRCTVNGAMDDFPKPHDLLSKPVVAIDNTALERQCSKWTDKLEH